MYPGNAGEDELDFAVCRRRGQPGIAMPAADCGRAPSNG
jgi:hypothetical protein